MSKNKTVDKDNSELTFKITTRVKATNKTPEMVYLSASNNLVRWGTFKKELIKLSCDDRELNDGMVFAEHGFWASKDQLDKLIKEEKIKVEMK
jgi:hypothetical protein